MAKRIKRLSKEQKKLVWAKSEANAGAGWDSHYSNPVDPRSYEYCGEPAGDLPLDDPLSFGSDQ